MPENETPQPITREEFEAGVNFFVYSKFDPMNTDTYNIESMEMTGYTSRYIVDKYKRLYCHIQKVEDDGFTFLNFTFKVQTEGKVLFKNCFKTEFQ